jgi:hypothetical protein
MQEAAEAVAPNEWTGPAGRLRSGWALSQPLVRSRYMVVVHELSEHVFEMVSSEDEAVIEGFSTNGADPPLGERVCAWRLEGQSNT